MRKENLLLTLERPMLRSQNVSISLRDRRRSSAVTKEKPIWKTKPPDVLRSRKEHQMKHRHLLLIIMLIVLPLAACGPICPTTPGPARDRCKQQLRDFGRSASDFQRSTETPSYRMPLPAPTKRRNYQRYDQNKRRIVNCYVASGIEFCQ